MVISILCADASQVCCIDNEKETFWEHMDQELSATPDGESVIVGGYLNRHIRRNKEGRKG